MLQVTGKAMMPLQIVEIIFAMRLSLTPALIVKRQGLIPQDCYRILRFVRILYQGSSRSRLNSAVAALFGPLSPKTQQRYQYLLVSHGSVGPVLEARQCFAFFVGFVGIGDLDPSFSP
jgi:hypothetical protein